jgi:hypothetical protein
MTTTMTRTLDTAKVTRVMRQFDTPADPGWCGWRIHRSTEDPGHVLITCDVPDSWARTMPGGATRQGIAQHLMRYAEALRQAGFGTATWNWKKQPDVLIVAPTQSAADEIAPGIRKHLTELNPDPDAKEA